MAYITNTPMFWNNMSNDPRRPRMLSWLNSFVYIGIRLKHPPLANPQTILAIISVVIDVDIILIVHDN